MIRLAFRDHYKEYYIILCQLTATGLKIRYLTILFNSYQTLPRIVVNWKGYGNNITNYTFTRTYVYESKMNVVARALLTFQILNLLQNIYTTRACIQEHGTPKSDPDSSSG